MRLSSTLLAHARPQLRARLAPSAALDVALEALVASARSAWPGVELPDEAFVAHLAERLPEEGDTLAALDATHAADLYLACACALGDPEAIAAFEKHYISQVARYLSRADALPAVADEVKQTLRANLLVGQGDLLPRIAGYSGRGPLGAWLRVSATRAALRLRNAERGKAEQPWNMNAFPAANDPELDYLRLHHARDLRAAFEATLAALSPRERSLLRLHFLEGMTVEAVAALYRVSGRTIKRWLARVRRGLLAETRRVLSERMQLTSTDLDSVIGLLRSQLDVSIVRFLDDSPADE